MVRSEVFTKMQTVRWCLRFALLAVFYSPVQFNLAAQSEADVNASIKKFTQVYEAVEANFADKVDPDHVVYRGAIPTMLRTLDPHSHGSGALTAGVRIQATRETAPAYAGLVGSGNRT